MADSNDYLTALPPELIHQVFEGLPVTDFLNVAQVSRPFNSIASDEQLIYKLIEEEVKSAPPGVYKLFLYAKEIFGDRLPFNDVILWKNIKNQRAFKGSEFLFSWQRCYYSAGQQGSVELYNYFTKLFDIKEGFKYAYQGSAQSSDFTLFAELTNHDFEVSSYNYWLAMGLARRTPPILLNEEDDLTEEESDNNFNYLAGILLSGMSNQEIIDFYKGDLYNATLEGLGEKVYSFLPLNLIERSEVYAKRVLYLADKNPINELDDQNKFGLSSYHGYLPDLLESDSTNENTQPRSYSSFNVYYYFNRRRAEFSEEYISGMIRDSVTQEGSNMGLINLLFTLNKADRTNRPILYNLLIKPFNKLILTATLFYYTIPEIKHELSIGGNHYFNKELWLNTLSEY